MKINIYYQGASAEASRLRIHSSLYDKTQDNDDREISFAKDGIDVKITLSSGYIEFKNEVYGFLEGDVNVQNANADDVFSCRPKDQWLVFSQYLYDEGLFRTLGNDEINHMESLLQSITGGMDSITQQGIDFFGGDVATQLESYEASMELASSVSALAFFSNKYLTGNTKEGFDNLVAAYAAHNENKLENYQSIEEKFYAARAQLSFIQIGPSAAKNVSVTKKLGRTKYDSIEWEQAMLKAGTLFSEIEDKADISAALETLREELLQLCLKGISKNDTDYTHIRVY